MIRYCSITKRASALSLAASGSASSSKIVARVDPKATVTIRSKAFILLSVRLPVARSRMISPI